MDRREEIYAKALELFIKDGYDQTPLSRIANELGMTKANLYHYFKSKEELLFYVHERNQRRDLIATLNTAEKIEDAKDRLVHLIRNYTENSMARDASAKVVIHEIGHLKAEHREIIKNNWKRFFDMVRDSLVELEATGRIKKMNKVFVAFALIGMCSWTLYWFDHSRQETVRELSDTYIDIFFNGVSKR